MLRCITPSAAPDPTDLATDRGRESGKKGQRRIFARKRRLLDSGRDISLFLTSLWHYSGVETSRSARAVQAWRM